MNKLLTGLFAITLGLGLASPVKALTEKEAAEISIGVNALTCIIAEGCPSYQPAHYSNRGFRRSGNFYRGGFYGGGFNRGSGFYGGQRKFFRNGYYYKNFNRNRGYY